MLQLKMSLLQIRKLLSFLNDSKGGVSLGTITLIKLNKLFICKLKKHLNNQFHSKLCPCFIIF